MIASVGCPLDIRWIKALKESALFHVHLFQFRIRPLSVTYTELVL